MRLKKISWLVLILLVLTYAVFGWLYASSTMGWLEREIKLGNSISDDLIFGIIETLGALFVLLVALAFTAPIATITLGFSSWLKSESKTLISLVFIALGSVIVLRWINYFVHVFVLLSAAILTRLELQTSGYNKWQTISILTFGCLLGFGSGVSIYSFWGYLYFPPR
jgi:hypothetical protein